MIVKATFLSTSPHKFDLIIDVCQVIKNNCYQGIAELSEDEHRFGQLCFRVEGLPAFDEPELGADDRDDAVHRVGLVARQVAEARHDFRISGESGVKNHLCKILGHDDT